MQRKCKFCGINLYIGKNWYKSWAKVRKYCCKKCGNEKATKTTEIRKKKDLFGYRSLSFRSTYKNSITGPQLKYLFEEQNGKCAICSQILDSCMQIDHIIPLSKGGLSIIENLQWLCERCNRGKFNWSQESYVEHCRKVAENKLGD